MGENGGKIIINKKVAKIGSKFRLKKNVFGFMIMLGTPKQVVSDLKMPKNPLLSSISSLQHFLRTLIAEI